jgi:transposase
MTSSYRPWPEFNRYTWSVLNRHRQEDIRQWLAEAFGAEYSLSGVYGLLHRLGQACRVPRSSHPRPDPAAQRAFKKSAA